MTTGAKGIELIELSEGFSPRLYDDVGHPCIGYGCDLTPEEAKSYEGRMIDKTEGEALMRSRLKPIEEAINNLIYQALTQDQFDALADFVYNLGEGAFRRSSLLIRLNNGDFVGAANELLRWVNVKGNVSEALKIRRGREHALFLHGDISAVG